MRQYRQIDSTAGGDADDFASQATQGSVGPIAEIQLFLKWWLLPVVVMLLGLAVLLVAGIALALFVYGLF